MLRSVARFALLTFLPIWAVSLGDTGVTMVLAHEYLPQHVGVAATCRRSGRSVGYGGD